MTDDTVAVILALATENAELRAALANAQDLLVETAVDAGELHARIEGLQAEVVALQTGRDASPVSGASSHLCHRIVRRGDP